MRASLDPCSPGSRTSPSAPRLPATTRRSCATTTARSPTPSATSAPASMRRTAERLVCQVRVWARSGRPKARLARGRGLCWRRLMGAGRWGLWGPRSPFLPPPSPPPLPSPPPPLPPPPLPLPPPLLHSPSTPLPPPPFHSPPPCAARSAGALPRPRRAGSACRALAVLAAELLAEAAPPTRGHGHRPPPLRSPRRLLLAAPSRTARRRCRRPTARAASRRSLQRVFPPAVTTSSTTRTRRPLTSPPSASRACRSLGRLRTTRTAAPRQPERLSPDAAHLQAREHVGAHGDQLHHRGGELASSAGSASNRYLPKHAAPTRSHGNANRRQPEESHQYPSGQA